MIARRVSAAALVAGVLAAPPALRAHPHVFIDTGVDFLFDAEGRISDLRITWIYDPLSSLFMLEDLGIDPAAQDLTPEARTSLAAYQTEWAPDFEGDSYLRNGAGPLALSGPLDPAAEIRNGRVVISFRRSLDVPLRPGPDTVVAIYDPTYFTAYMVTETPRIVAAPEGCRARVEPFEPSGPLVALQQTLFELGADETPEQPDVGALFAEHVHVTCG